MPSREGSVRLVPHQGTKRAREVRGTDWLGCWAAPPPGSTTPGLSLSGLHLTGLACLRQEGCPCQSLGFGNSCSDSTSWPL